MIRQHQPELLCLVETKISNTRPSLLQLGFLDVLEVLLSGRRGGLAIAWQRGVRFDVKQCNPNFVNLMLLSDPLDIPWLLSFVYDPSVWNESS